jgi:hypothetical protein
MKQPPKSENHIKDMIRQWCDRREAHHFAIVQSGMGVHGLPDRLACVPIVVTPEMVGKRIGLLVGIEAKRPGRRNEPRRGMSAHQELQMEGIRKAGGLFACVDGEEDLLDLDALLFRLAHHG